MTKQCGKSHDEKLKDLDNPATYDIDGRGVYTWIRKWDQLLIAHPRPDGLPAAKSVREVLVCGMGGSAISGDVALLAVQRTLAVPCRVVRGYTMPASLGKSTLQIVVSYSGNTEEAIWAYTQGHNKGAMVVVVCAGGALQDLAIKHGKPIVRIPSDCPAPRLALGYMVTAILAVLDGVFEGILGPGEIGDAVIALRRGTKRFERELASEKNIAKRLASEIHGAFPVVIGSELTWPAALRFQTQLNENAKWPAHAAMLPEMNHNEIVAYTTDGPATARTGVILLRDKDDHPRVQLRQDFTADMLEGKVAWVRQLKGEGKSVFSRTLNLIQAADYTSYYLACGRGIDPIDIASISMLKDRMGKVK